MDLAVALASQNTSDDSTKPREDADDLPLGGQSTVEMTSEELRNHSPAKLTEKGAPTASSSTASPQGIPTDTSSPEEPAQSAPTTDSAVKKTIRGSDSGHDSDASSSDAARASPQSSSSTETDTVEESEAVRDNPFDPQPNADTNDSQGGAVAAAAAAPENPVAEPDDVTDDKAEPAEWIVPDDPLKHYGSKAIVLMAVRGAPGNRKCADCGRLDPDWADLNFGVLLCIDCCGAHRALNKLVPVVRSLSIDSQWTEDQFKLLLRGNKNANGCLEKRRPQAYPKPLSDDATILRLQYILAKYDNQEFTGQPLKEPTYGQNEMLAKFLKRHRYRDDWAQRDFYLSVAEGKICYGLPANQYGSPCRPTGKNLKGTIPILSTHTEIVSAQALELENTESILMLMFPEEGADSPRSPRSPKARRKADWVNIGNKAPKVRTVFVKRSGGAVQPIVEWMVAIKRIQILSSPAAPLGPILTMGWMMKKGQEPSSSWKKRWFILDDMELRYYVGPMEGLSSGSIPLGPSKDGFKVWSSVADSMDCNEFTIRVPGSSRDFWLAAYTHTDFQVWISLIKKIIDGIPEPEAKK